MTFDWPKIVLNIRRSGLSYRAIERKVGMDKDNLGRYARGELTGDPRFGQGLKLLDLHFALCPDRHNLEALRK